MSFSPASCSKKGERQSYIFIITILLFLYYNHSAISEMTWFLVFFLHLCYSLRSLSILFLLLAHWLEIQEHKANVWKHLLCICFTCSTLLLLFVPSSSRLSVFQSYLFLSVPKLFSACSLTALLHLTYCSPSSYHRFLSLAAFPLPRQRWPHFRVSPSFFRVRLKKRVWESAQIILLLLWPLILTFCSFSVICWVFAAPKCTLSESISYFFQYFLFLEMVILNKHYGTLYYALEVSHRVNAGINQVSLKSYSSCNYIMP